MEPSWEMDSLLLEGLEVPCRVGCTASERAVPQSLRVDVQLYCRSLRGAGQTDDLDDTVDFGIASDLIAAVQRDEYRLVERVAEVLAGVALGHRLVERVQVTVRKRPPVSSLEIAAVRITRSRA